MFIYLITNKINGKYYVGLTTQTIEKRWKGHIKESRNKRSLRSVCRAIRCHGEQNFKIEVLCECPSVESLNETEKFFVRTLASYKKSFGYNDTMGGDGVSAVDEVRRRMSESQKGKKKSPELQEKITKAIIASKVGVPAPNKGLHHSPETLAKMRSKAEDRRGVKRPKEFGEHLSKMLKGKTKSEEHKEKLRKANLGKKLSQETINKMVETRKGFKHSSEAIEKIRLWHTGRKLSEETKQKIRDTKKRKREEKERVRLEGICEQD